MVSHSVVNMELPGRRKSSTFYHNGDGFYYQVYTTNFKYQASYVKCIDKDCGGRGKFRLNQPRKERTVIMIVAHNHGPSFDLVWKHNIAQMLAMEMESNELLGYRLEVPRRNPKKTPSPSLPSNHEGQLACSAPDLSGQPKETESAHALIGETKELLPTLLHHTISTPVPIKMAMCKLDNLDKIVDAVENNGRPASRWRLSRPTTPGLARMYTPRYRPILPKPVVEEKKKRGRPVKINRVTPDTEVNPRNLRRTTFTTAQLDVLKSLFDKTHFPDSSMRKDVAKKIKLPTTTVKIWFQNQRSEYRKKCSANPPSPLTLPSVPEPPIFDNNLSNNVSASPPPNNDDVVTKESPLDIPTYHHHQSMTTNTTQLTAHPTNLPEEPATPSGECSREPSPVMTTSSPPIPNISPTSYQSVPQEPTANFGENTGNSNATSQNYGMGTECPVTPSQPVNQLHPTSIQKESLTDEPTYYHHHHYHYHSMTANAMQSTAQERLAMPEGEFCRELPPTNMMPSPSTSINSTSSQFDPLEQTINILGQMGNNYLSLNQMFLARYNYWIAGYQPPGQFGWAAEL